MRFFEKTIIWSILSFFLFHVVLPPAVLANMQTIDGQQEPVSIIKFADNVSEAEQDLLQAFIDQLVVLSDIYPRFRTQQFALNRQLEQGVILLDLVGKEHLEIAAEVEEVLKTANYILKKGGPLEQDLEGNVAAVETQFREQFSILTSGGIVPGGFMDTCRNLDYYYNISKTAFDTKGLLMLKYVSFLDSILTQLEQKSDLSAKIAPLRSHLVTIESEAALLAELTGRVNLAIAGFNSEKETYNKIAIANYEEEKQRTSYLQAKINTEIDLLSQSGDVNSQRHAKLLAKINQSLHHRLLALKEQQSDDSKINPSGNFLYIPGKLSGSSGIVDLVSEYSSIANGLIANTGKRRFFVHDFKQGIDQASLNLLDHTKSLTVLGDFLVSSKATEFRDAYLELQSLNRKIKTKLQGLAGQLDTVAGLYDELNWQNPDSIINSQANSWKVIEINYLVEEIINQSELLDISKQKFDFLAALLVSGLDEDGISTVENPPVRSLFQVNDTFSRSIADLFKDIEVIQESYNFDRKLIVELEKLAGEIIQTAGQKYKNTIVELEKRVTVRSTKPGSLYSEGLAGTLGVLKNKKDLSLKIADRVVKKISARTTSSDCPDCFKSSTPWKDLTSIGNALSNVLSQIHDLQYIPSLFDDPSEDVFAEGNLLFQLTDKLRLSPLFILHEKSIDVGFVLNDVVLYVKGIGDPTLLSLASTILPVDGEIRPGYIGGFGFRDAWNAIGNTTQSVISGTKSALTRGASSVISGAKYIKGKLTTAASRAASITKSVVSTIATKTGSFFRGAYKLGGNVLSEMFLDNGELSLLKTGAFALGAAACIATGGLACVAFGIGAGADVLKGMVETYGTNQVLNEKIKMGINVVSFLAGGFVNLGSAGKNLSGIGKLFTFIGLNPGDLKNFFRGGVWKGGASSLRRAWNLIKGGKWKGMQTLVRTLRPSNGIRNAIKQLLDFIKTGKNVYDGKGPFGFVGDMDTLEKAIREDERRKLGLPPSGTNTGSGPGSGGTNTGSGPGSGGTNTGSGPGSGGTNTGSGPGSGGTNTGSGSGSGGTNTGSGPGSGGTNTGSGPGSGGTNTGSGPGSGSTNTGSGPGSGSTNTGSGPGSGSTNTGSGPGSGGTNTGSGPGTAISSPGAINTRGTGTPLVNSGSQGSNSQNSGGTQLGGSQTTNTQSRKGQLKPPPSLQKQQQKTPPPQQKNNLNKPPPFKLPW